MIYAIIEFFATCTDVLFMVWFITRFLNVSFISGNRPWNYILPISLLAFQLVADKFLPAFDIFSLLVALAISASYSISVSEWRRNKFSTLIAPCIFISVAMASGSAVYVIFSMFIDDIDAIMQGATENERIIYVLVSIIIRFILFKTILLLFKSRDSIDKKNGFFIIVCFALMAIGLGILMYTSVEYPIVKPSVVFALVMIITSSNFALYFLIYKLQKYRRKEYYLYIL